MEGQDILSKVETLEEDKVRKEAEKQERKERKEQEKEIFYRCKSKCVCEGVCAAKDLMEWPHCHSVMKSK